MVKRKPASSGKDLTIEHYDEIFADITGLLEEARRTAARTVNAFMTATYWAIGERIVRYEQGGRRRARYGEELLKRLSRDLQSRFGRGFSERNLEQMRLFYMTWPIPQTTSAKSNGRAISQTASAKSTDVISKASGNTASLPIFSLSWSHYVHLMLLASLSQLRARALDPT